MSTAPEEVTYEPPIAGAGPCATAKCTNQAQKYGNAVGGRPSSPLCNVCLAKVVVARKRAAA
ncbi:hypothetical protein [Streptomyces sp. KN37]|uniref:hypothetical protein n=1 Tax=Streptomyces sp. KN37 TaxID=3090667 RepID=UPI002A75DD92|nr:hypothetical protein [Streptomyces sp. KN37]WPO70177.1 hypothetical protein R9806_05825 [Streptomyces sp. KN37]WPO74052.1 hypothetical protein R9806_27235 [Streptomyces sp. KN37]